MKEFHLDNLIAINRNKNGDYYFLFSIDGVVNHIRPGSKSRNEVLIVGVPQSKLVSFLHGSGATDDFQFFICEEGDCL